MISCNPVFSKINNMVATSLAVYDFLRDSKVDSKSRHDVNIVLEYWVVSYATAYYRESMPIGRTTEVSALGKVAKKLAITTQRSD